MGVSTKKSKAEATQQSGGSSRSAQTSEAVPQPKTPPLHLRMQMGRRDPLYNKDGTWPMTLEEYDRAQTTNDDHDDVPPEPSWYPAFNIGMGKPPPPPPIHPPKAPPKAPPQKSKAQRSQELWEYQQARTRALHVEQQRWVRENNPFNPLMKYAPIPGDPNNGI